MVSVVLPVYNGGDEVCSAISEMERQTFKEFELLVVDDGSTDDTAAVATKCGNAVKDFRVIRTSHGGPSHARNVGLADARGRIVFFGELDCVYESTYLQTAVERLANDPEASAVSLTGAPLVTKSTLATECLDIENKAQHKLLSEGKIKPFYAWVFRKDALQKVGGFDERLFQAEDKDLFRKIEAAGYKVALVPGIHWWHRRNQTTWDLAKKWFSRGRSRLLFALKHRMAGDLARRLAPVWLFIAGLLIAIVSPILGFSLSILILAGIVVYSLRTIAVTWHLVSKKRFYLGYPAFVIARNFSMGIGYTVGLAAMLVRKVQGKPITWETV
jgi:glycosyltransferase involved in cell wall biosynthesis